MGKRINIVFISFVLCLLFLNCVYAETEKKYVFDYTESLTEEELSQLEGLATDISENYEIDAYFVMTNDTGELDTIEYTEQFYEDYAAGTDCVIMVLTTDQYYVLPLGKCADIFTYVEYENLYDAYYYGEDYYGGIAGYYEEVSVIAEDYVTKNQIDQESDDYQGKRMNDDANIIEDISESTASDKLDDISNKYDCNVVAFTTASMKDASNASEYYSYYYSGFGIIFMISSENNEWNIIPIGDDNQKKVFTDAGVEYIKDQIEPLMKKSNYDDAVSKYTELCEDFLRQAETGDPYDEHNLPEDSFNIITAIVAVVAGVAVVVVATMVVKYYRKKGQA